MIADFTAGELDMYIDRGDTYRKDYILSWGAGYLDLTGYTLSTVFKEYYGVPSISISSSFTVNSYTGGNFTLVIPYTETSKFVKNRYEYSIVATNGSETVQLIRGHVLVSGL